MGYDQHFQIKYIQEKKKYYRSKLCKVIMNIRTDDAINCIKIENIYIFKKYSLVRNLTIQADSNTETQNYISSKIRTIKITYTLVCLMSDNTSFFNDLYRYIIFII